MTVLPPPGSRRPTCCLACRRALAGPVKVRRGLCVTCYNHPAIRRRYPPAGYPRVPSCRPTHCRHCQRSLADLVRVRRGLCGPCYQDPTIRAQYSYLGTLAGLNGRPLLSRPGHQPRDPATLAAFLPGP